MARRPTTLKGSWPGLKATAVRFRDHIREQRKLLAGGLLALVAEVGFRLLEPWPLAYVIDAVVASSGSDLATRGVWGGNLTVLIAVCAGAVVAVVALRALMSYLMSLRRK